MTPETDHILNLSAMKLISEFAPALGTQYGQGMAQVVAVLMFLSAQEFERGAAIRAAENADMRAVFAALAPRIGDAALRAELQKAGAGTEGDLTISALNAVNADLRRLLIRLHAQLDDSGADASAVWTVLKAMAARRTLSLPAL